MTALTVRSERLGPDQVEVVRRRVVLLELAFAGPAERPDRKVESGRVELALVPAPRNEVHERLRSSTRPSTYAAAGSMSVSPRRLRLYVSGAGSPRTRGPVRRRSSTSAPRSGRAM